MSHSPEQMRKKAEALKVAQDHNMLDVRGDKANQDQNMNPNERFLSGPTL